MMGEQRGFEDARGTLFFRIAEIIKEKIDRGHKPAAVILENVKALKPTTRDGLLRQLKGFWKRILAIRYTVIS